MELLDLVPKNKRQNFENMTVIKEAPKSLIHAKMEQAGLAAAVGFADEVGALSLEKKIECRLTDECLSMYYLNVPRGKL